MTKSCIADKFTSSASPQQHAATQSSPTMQPAGDWQSALREVITDVAELQAILQLPELPFGGLPSGFALRVPRAFVQRMQVANPLDPLLLQVLPQARELQSVPGFVADPLQEQQASPVPGVLHKFKNRVLLTLTGGCAVHCRYCFRQHFPYNEHNLTPKRWQPMLDYIAQHPEVHEVILSGGDPLLLKNNVLARLHDALTNISHVRCIRIHTRLPVVIPARLDAEFLKIIDNSRVPVVLVLHCNHPQELDQSVQACLQPLRQMPHVTLLNQSVLLHQINDNAEVLAALSERLFACGVLPYYLHLLDKTHGTAHFAVRAAQAQTIMWQLHERLPGYLLPKLVREVPGLPSKLPVALGACPWLQG